MDVIIKTIKEAFQDNLEAVFLLIVVVGLMYLINIVLGSILGAKEIGFDFKKFMFGFLKGLIASICIFVFCFVLNLFALTLKLIDIQISIDVITTIEVIGVLAIWAIDMSKEIIEKIQSLRQLKYVSYDEINNFDIDRG